VSENYVVILGQITHAGLMLAWRVFVFFSGTIWVRLSDFFREIKSLEFFYGVYTLCLVGFKQLYDICFSHSSPVSVGSILLTPEIFSESAQKHSRKLL
jgi:hypothetical protein